MKLFQQRLLVSAVVGIGRPFECSTFSCDIAYSDSPAASRASVGL